MISILAGERLEGSRVYYNTARSVSNRLTLTRELERSRALRLDLVKGHVRLSPSLWPLLARGAHGLGVPVTSHYLWPGIALGGNSVEHIDATDRKRPAASGRERPATGGGGPGEPGDAGHVLRRIVRRGGHITVGADSPLGPPALMVELNLQAYVRYGLTPYQALRAATVECARLIGHAGDLGSVERGKLAGLAFVRRFESGRRPEGLQASLSGFERASSGAA